MAAATGQKWEIDDIIAPEAKKDAEPFTCSVCLSVWTEPLQTPCHHIFCKACVVDRESPTTICPCCRTTIPADGFQPLEKVNQFVLRMLNNLRVICPYSKKPATRSASASTAADGQEDSGGTSSTFSPAPRVEPRPAQSCGPAQCDWAGSFADLNRHLGSCQWCVVPCPHGCGEEMQRSDLTTHTAACERNRVSCDICGEQVRPHDLDKHNKDEAERHVELLRKRITEMRSASVLEELRTLRQEVQNVQNTQTTMKEELEKKLDTLAKPASTVWVIADPAALRASTPRGSHKDSPTFTIEGVKMKLLFFPSGSTESSDGHFGLFLEFENAELKWTVTAAGQTKEYHKVIGPCADFGHHDFGQIAFIPEEGQFEVEVKILSAVKRIS